MRERPKILILTAKYGNGHVQVAHTLEQKLHELGIDNVKVIDLFAEAHPIITEFTKYLYLKCFTVGPQFYRLFYYGIEKIHDKKIAYWYRNFGKRRLSLLLDQEKPDIIINTFPLIVVPELQTKRKSIIPTYNVVTDFCLHQIWIHREIEKYYVATEEVKNRLIQKGVEGFKVLVTGIPIRDSFTQGQPLSSLYKKYGLNTQKKTILIMAGAHGVLKHTVEHCESLLQADSIQLIVVCGSNRLLKEELNHLVASHKDRLFVFGYVERVDELFRVSTCMITKPGGITLSEAASIGLPLVLYKPVPGQENENAKYFQAKGAAIIVDRPEYLLNEVTHLLKYEERLLSMKNNLKDISKSNSAQTIIEDILLQYENRSHIHQTKAR
ncbi:diglucosyl diacylglycerol synthase [Bacillus sp. AK128]